MDLVRPDDSRYDQTRSIFNGMIDRHPAVIARCASAADVIQALQLARAGRLDVAVRAGGHSVAGMCLNDDGLVIDVRPMKQLAVDARSRRVRVGAGVTWGEFDRAAQAHGLATTGGRVSTTGVAGFTLAAARAGRSGLSGWLATTSSRSTWSPPAAGRSPRAKTRIPACSGRCTAAEATSGWPPRSCSVCMNWDRW
jgi:FAD/FMN-containing dehydrogenase